MRNKKNEGGKRWGGVQKIVNSHIGESFKKETRCMSKEEERGWLEKGREGGRNVKKKNKGRAKAIERTFQSGGKKGLVLQEKIPHTEDSAEEGYLGR